MGGALGGTSLVVLLVLVTVGGGLKPGPGLLPRAIFILAESDRTQVGPVRSSCEKKEAAQKSRLTDSTSSRVP